VTSRTLEPPGPASGAESIDFTIRPMRLEDVPRVHAIDTLSFRLPWPDRSYRFELVENPSSELWVAEVQQAERFEVVGMIVLWVIVDEAHIGSLAVHPDYRRQGIAQALLVRSLQAAAWRGATQATLEVRRSNLAAQALYRRFGFEVVGIRPRYYRDNQEDALLMTAVNYDPAALQQLLEQPPGPGRGPGIPGQ